MKKRIQFLVISCLLAISMMQFIPVNQKMVKADLTRISFANAKQISFGQRYTGSILSINSENYYKFTLTASGKVRLSLAAQIRAVDYYIYDSKGEEQYHKWISKNDVTGMCSSQEEIYLTRGTYYFVIEGSAPGDKGIFDFGLNFENSGESFIESGNGINNSMETASNILLGKGYKGQIAENDEKDFYKFTLSSSGRIRLKISTEIRNIYYYIYDSSGNELWSAWKYIDSNSGKNIIDENVDLTKGNYYLVVRRANGTGNYSFNIGFENAYESFIESENGIDNDMARAHTISLNQGYRGQIAENDEKDFYKFYLPSSAKITLTASAKIKDVYYYIYDSAGNEIWRTYEYEDSRTGKSVTREEIQLKAGTYYFLVRQSGTGPYSFGVYKYTSISSASVRMSGMKYTYTGKAIKPSVTVKKGSTILKNGRDYTVSYRSNRNVGKGRVIIRGKGQYNGTSTKTFIINPKRTSLKRVKARSRGFKLYWKKQLSQVSGYQIQYATNRKFSKKKSKSISKNTTTAVTIKKLKKKKKYYVRIRTYKNSGGKKYVSAWSAIKMVRTKK